MLATLIGLALVCAREWNVMPDGKAHVHMLDIGQGDAIFIVGPSGEQVLIDGGPDGSVLTAMATHVSFFDRHIDLLVLTHPDLDHVASFPTILRRYDVGAVLMTGVDSSTGAYREFLDLLKRKQIPVIIADPSKDINLGDDLMMDVLWPPPMYAGVETPKNLNDTSVVFRLTFGRDSVLFTGDMEEMEERELLASGANVRAAVLKVGHHGSRTSTSTGLLLAVQPSLALISAGRDNSFGHPHDVIMRRLRAFGIPARVTSKEGVISIELDGE